MRLQKIQFERSFEASIRQPRSRSQALDKAENHSFPRVFLFCRGRVSLDEPAQKVAHIGGTCKLKVNQLAFCICLAPIRGSCFRSTLSRGCGVPSLKASEFGVCMARVRGSSANIRSAQYRTVKPRNTYDVTWGQLAHCAAKAADQASIPSEASGSLGREDFCFMDASVLEQIARRAAVGVLPAPPA
jgi:hypothetical protein